MDALCICMLASLLSLATNGNSVFCKSLASTLSIMRMFRAFDAGLFDEARSSPKSDLLYEPRSSPCACTFWSYDCAICCCERVEFSSFMLYSMLLNSLPSWHGANWKLFATNLVEGLLKFDMLLLVSNFDFLLSWLPSYLLCSLML